MSLQRIAILLVAIAWVAGDEALATPPEPRARTNRCYAMRVEAVSHDASEPQRRRRYRRRFEAHELLDLKLSVLLPEKADPSLVEIHLYTPTGRLYQVLRASADAGASEDRTRSRRRRSRVMSARLPVAGSHITSRSLYGTWHADVFLDGSEERCTRRPTEFAIDP